MPKTRLGQWTIALWIASFGFSLIILASLNAAALGVLSEPLMAAAVAITVCGLGVVVAASLVTVRYFRRTRSNSHEG
jgi:uncharacterized membrane protein (DUF485 family)